MKILFKIVLVGILASSTVACSSTSAMNEVTTVKVGQVKRVIYSKVEKKPSVMTVLAGAALGGLVGNQFGGGSGKDWATGVGAVLGGVTTDRALTNKYNQVTYDIYIPSQKTRIGIVSGDLRNNIFRNDVVVVYTKGRKIWIDAYGQFTKQKYYLINQKLKDGTLE